MVHTGSEEGQASEEADREYWERYDHPVDFDNPGDSRAVVLGCLSADPQRVLELGCSTGTMTRVLAERGHSVTAIEIDPVAARVARPYADRLLVGDLDWVDLDGRHLLSDLEPGGFDTLIAADVLEHLRDPDGCLRRALTLVRPGGRIILSIPNVAHVDVRLALFGGNFDYRDWGLLDRTHVHLFTLKTLVAMIRDAGLAPIAWQRVRSPIGGTEIEIDEDLLEFGRRVLSDDPEGETYQWIVTCQDSAVAGSDAVWPTQTIDGSVATHVSAVMNAPVAHPGVVDPVDFDEAIGRSGQVGFARRARRILGRCRDRVVNSLVPGDRQR